MTALLAPTDRPDAIPHMTLALTLAGPHGAYTASVEVERAGDPADPSYTARTGEDGNAVSITATYEAAALELAVRYALDTVLGAHERAAIADLSRGW